MPTALPVPRRSASARKRAFPRIASSPAALLRLLRRWGRRHRQRCDLGDLDDRLLDDIGLTRRQADEERRKPFWR